MNKGTNGRFAPAKHPQQAFASIINHDRYQRRHFLGAVKKAITLFLKGRIHLDIEESKMKEKERLKIESEAWNKKNRELRLAVNSPLQSFETGWGDFVLIFDESNINIERFVLIGVRYFPPFPAEFCVRVTENSSVKYIARCKTNYGHERGYNIISHESCNNGSVMKDEIYSELVTYGTNKQFIKLMEFELSTLRSNIHAGSFQVREREIYESWEQSAMDMMTMLSDSSVPFQFTDSIDKFKKVL
jgi:hypothetical protein